jgi:hypothetical protein
VTIFVALERWLFPDFAIDPTLLNRRKYLVNYEAL